MAWQWSYVDSDVTSVPTPWFNDQESPWLMKVDTEVGMLVTSLSKHAMAIHIGAPPFLIYFSGDSPKF